MRYINVFSENVRFKKKAALPFVFILLAAAVSFLIGVSASAAEERSAMEKEIADKIAEQLSNLDTSDFQTFIDGLSAEEYELFGGKNFKDIVTSIVSGDFKSGYSNFFSAMLGIVGKEAVKVLPTLASVAVIAVFSGILAQMRPNFLSKSTGEIIYFVFYGAVILLLMNGVMQLIAASRGAVASMKAQMNIVFPILLTLMTALGGTVSVSVYQPAVAMLSGGAAEIVSNVVFPLFIVVIVFSVVGNLSNSVKLGKMTDFFKSSSVWLIGIVFTVFMSFLAIKGITAAAYDGISIRAAKFAAKTYIPILGGYLTDGFDLIMAGTSLLKNAAGLAGVYLLLATVVAPVLQIVIFGLGLKLTAAVIEPVADKRVSDFIQTVGKNLSMLTVAVIAVGFMYLITIMLVILTGNSLF